MSGRGALGAVVVVLVALLPACGVGDPSDREASEPPAPEPASITWEACGALDCGRLTVPLDHDEPDGPTIDLAVARAPARDPGARVGVLVVNPGGPGGSGVNFVSAGVPVGSEVSDHFDVIGFDPRGVGDSSAIDCGDEPEALLALDPDPDDDREQQELDAAAEAVAEACATDAGDLLDHVDSVTVARDIDVLRAALGEEQISYLGYSYGTVLGLHYAERFGDRVRAMVLDGVVDPEQDLPELLTAQTAGFDASFDAMAAACDEDPDCPLDDLAATYDQIAAVVDEQPIPAGDGAEVGPAEVALGAVYSGYDASTWPLFADALADAVDGDGALLLGFADAYLGLSEYGPYAAVTCVDLPHPPDPAGWRDFADRLDRQSPRFGAAVANELLPCATWPAEVTGDPAPVTAEDAPTVLVVGTTGDPATPYANAERVAATLADAVLLTNDGDDHTSSASSTCRRIIGAYLTDLTAPAAGTRC